MTLKVDLRLKPQLGASEDEVRQLVPAEKYGQHGAEDGPAGHWLTFRITGENRVEDALVMAARLVGSPLVMDAEVQTVAIRKGHVDFQTLRPGHA